MRKKIDDFYGKGKPRAKDSIQWYTSHIGPK